jgi:hypothetical protein
MSKLIKRKDGSYSKRGLWDNIRKNKGSGKEPTKEMLKQESKIKKEENMKSMYKKGGKAPKKKMMKDSFMEESKEITFDSPRMKMGGMMKYEKGGADPGKGLFDKIKDVQEDLKNTKSSASPYEQENYKLILKEREKMKSAKEMYPIDRGIEKSVFFNSVEDAERANEVDKLMLENARKFRPASKKTGGMIETGMESNGRQNRAEGKATMAGKKMMGGKMYKKGGAKTMEPGGGGRFAKMVSGLKKEGKSEDSAKAIAASAGRKKYGKNRFQEMAAAGKKKMMGGKKC